MNIGAAIEKCRKLQGITKSALAAKAGVSAPYMTQIVQGGRAPALNTVEQIAGALNLPTALLVIFASDRQELKALPDDLWLEIQEIILDVQLAKLRLEHSL